MGIFTQNQFLTESIFLFSQNIWNIFKHLDIND